jgi:hypothetical protein
VSGPEYTGDSDPTIGPLEELLAAMGSERIGSAAVSGATAPEEVPGPLLPSTPNDVKWEAWHRGEVSLINCADDTHLGGVIKVYRNPKVEAVYTLQPPIGPKIQISLKDIIQIFPRDRNGNLPDDPTYIFQGDRNVPGGYTVRYEDDSAAESDDLAQLDDSGHDTRVIITDDLADPERIMGERLDGDNRRLRFLSNLFREEGSGPFYPDYPIDRQTTLVWYPLNGKPLNVITPSGYLIKGHHNDIVEVVRTYPDASRTPLRRTTLSKLSQEDNYMVINEVYNGR